MAFEAFAAIIVGLSGGLAVGGGFVAFIAVLGIIPRLIQLSKRTTALRSFEWAIILGALTGSVATLHGITLKVSPFFTLPVGLLAGMFIGMLAAALAEVLNVFPIFTRRLKLEKYLIFLMMAIVLGKITGSLFQWLFFVKY